MNLDYTSIFEVRGYLVEALETHAQAIGEEHWVWVERQHPGFSTRERSMGVPGNVRKALAYSTIVYWDPSIAEAARNGASEAFSDVEFDLATLGSLTDGQPQCWFVGGAFSSPTPEMCEYFQFEDDAWVSPALLIYFEGDAADWKVVAIEFFLHQEGDQFDLRKLRLRSHGIITKEVANQPNEANEWKAMFSFMRLPFVEVQKQQLPRSERRRAERENRELPDINIVHLRRPAQSETGHSQQGREWQHQWIVRGHWRKQWYPSQETHKPVYVSPYMKGDPDKPLLSRPVVYKVVR